MASHDFCYGCDECRREERNMYRSIEIDRIKNAINQIKDLGASAQTEYTTQVISDLERKIEQIKSQYEYKKR